MGKHLDPGQRGVRAAGGGDLCIGVMSGTSLDGVDAVLANFADGRCSGVVAVHHEFTPELRAELQDLQSPGANEFARGARAANALADAYAAAINDVVAVAGVCAADIRVAGVHGQTVRHDPAAGWTLQLNAPARVVERTGIPVVADFRSRDIAAGGEGAPLVPAFHAALFGVPDLDRAIVNIGGIANVTLLPAATRAAPVSGFDTGPGNVLLDLWCARHLGTDFDCDGNWARSGRVDAALLGVMLEEPFFARRPPKSTGRDLFNRAWLDGVLGPCAAGGLVVSPVDVQRTLVALTARTLGDALRRRTPENAEIFVCGGGALNPVLLTELAAELAPRPVSTTADLGVAVLHVEALAFAWLAREALAGRPGNLPAVTGARGLRVLGALYPR